MVLPLSLLLACAAKEAKDSGPLPLADTYTLSDEGLFPEGVAFHPGERAFFMGSLSTGAMTRLDAGGAEAVFFEPGEGWMSLGMKIDAARDALVVCAIEGYGGEDVRSELWRFDPVSGERLAAVDLDAAFTGSSCNDVAIDASGDTYVTDRESPNLYKVSGERVELWATDALLSSTLIGLNGVVVAGDTLLVGVYSPPRVLRIPLDDPADIQEVQVSGDPLGTLPDGLDGMILVDDRLVIAGNTQVLELESGDGWATATATARPQSVGVAAVTEAEGAIYGLKGEVPAFVLGLEADLPFELRVID